MSFARQAPPTPRGLAMIGLAAVSWGTSGSVMTVLAADAAASPLLVGSARLWIAALVLLAGTRLAGRFRLGHGDAWRVLAMGACMAAYQAAYFSAVLLAGIAVVALVAICSAPLMIAALAPRALGERLTSRTRLALGLGVGGTALLVATPHAAVGAPTHAVVGALLALVAGLAYALYVLVAKASFARAAPLPLTALTFGVGALLLTPALAWVEAPLRQVAAGWPWLLYLGGVATAAAYAVYAIGLREVPASMAGVVTLLEPLTATLLGVAVFGERLGAIGLAGGLLVFAALALLVGRRAPAAAG